MAGQRGPGGHLSYVPVSGWAWATGILRIYGSADRETDTSQSLTEVIDSIPRFAVGA